MDLTKSKNSINDKILWLCLLVVVADAFFLAFYNLRHNSIWLDEAYTVLVSLKGFNGIIESLMRDTGPPLHYILLGWWMKIFSPGEFEVRALSGIFYLIALPFVYLTAKRFGGNQAGVLCTALYALSRIAVRHSINARMYSLLALLSIVSTFLFIKYFYENRDGKSGILLYAIVGALGTLTHYFFFFVIFSHLLVCLIMCGYSIKKYLQAFLLSGLPFLVFWTPVFLQQVQASSMAWFKKPSILTGIPSAITDFFAGWWVLILIFAVASCFLRYRCDRSREEDYRPGAAVRDLLRSRPMMLFILLFAVSSVTPLLVSQIKPVYVTGRTTIVLCFPFIILVGLFLTRFGEARVNNVFCIVLALVIGAHTFWSRNLPEIVSDRASAEYLMNNAHEGDIIVFTSLSRSAVEYYFDLNGYRDKFHLLSFPAELDRHPGFRDLEKMTANSSVYSEEAGRLLENLSREADGNKTVWLLYGIDTEISSLLKKKLEDSFTRQSEVNQPGVFHTSILSYIQK